MDGVLHPMHFLDVFVSLAVALIQSIMVLLGRNAGQWTFYLLDQSPILIQQSVLDAIFTTRTPHQPEPNWGAVMNMSSAMPVAQCVSSAWNRGDTVTPKGCLLRTHSAQSVTTVMDAFNPHLILMALAWGNAIFALCESLVRNHNLLRNWKYGKTIVASFVVVLTVVVDMLCQYVISKDDDSVLRYPTILAQLLILLPCVYYAYKTDMIATGTDPQSNHHSLKLTAVWKVAMHQQFISVPLVVTMFAAMGMRLWPILLSQLLTMCVAVNVLWALLMKLCSQTLGKVLCFLIPVGSAVVILRSSVAGPLSGWREMTAALSIFALLPFVLLSFGHSRISHAHVVFGVEFWCVTATIFACVVDLGLLSSSS